MQDAIRPVVEVPVIETERLQLRAHRVDDFAACAAMWADPIVTRHIGGKPFSPEETWTKILRYAGLWSLLGFGYWAIVEKASGEFIGEMGFADFKRDLEPSLKDMPELGWALVSRAHGKGYATEAVRAATAWGDQRFPGSQTICLIHPENIASIRVAEKCGFRPLQRTTYKSHEIIVLVR